MSSMILEVQKQRLQEMKKYLSCFCDLMDKNMNELQVALKEMEIQGVSKGVYEKYEKMYLEPEKIFVEQMINRITSMHFSYIDDIITDIQKAIYCSNEFNSTTSEDYPTSTDLWKDIIATDSHTESNDWMNV